MRFVRAEWGGVDTLRRCGHFGVPAGPLLCHHAQRRACSPACCRHHHPRAAHAGWHGSLFKRSERARQQVTHCLLFDLRLLLGVIVLCCAVLCCAVLCCAVLCCAMLCCAAQQCVLLCSVLFFSHIPAGQHPPANMQVCLKHLFAVVRL